MFYCLLRSHIHYHHFSVMFLWHDKKLLFFGSAWGSMAFVYQFPTFLAFFDFDSYQWLKERILLMMVSAVCLASEDAQQLLTTTDVQEILSKLKSVCSNCADNDAAAVAFVHGFVEALLRAFFCDTEQFETAKIVLLAKKVFHYADMNLLVLQNFATKMRSTTVIGDNSTHKLAHFFASLPILPGKSPVNLLNESQLKLGKISLNSARQCFYLQSAWFELLKIEFCPKIRRLLLPRFIESVMDHLPNCELFTDVLYRTFRLGGFMSVISLGGIFKLVVKQNFEHPNFYAEVYQIMHPNICYSNYARKFFDLVDLIMSSTHIPSYVVCAFTKKLCRLLLFAPAHCQLPLVRLIKNLFCRHPTIHSVLINRPQPFSLDKDPYDEEQLDLQKCGAVDSSLWELKALRWHWHDRVAAKANFVNSNVQDEEASLGWQSKEELFNAIIGRAKAILAANSGKRAAEEDEDEEALMEDDEEGREEEEEENERECYYPDAVDNGAAKRRKASAGRDNGRRGEHRYSDSLFDFEQKSVWAF